MQAGRNTRVTLRSRRATDTSHEGVVEFQALGKHSERVKEEVEEVLPRACSLTPVTTEQK